MKTLTNPTKYFFQQAEHQSSLTNNNAQIDKLVGNLVNLEQCPLCRKKYVADFQSPQIPRILIHCGHTFCHECLMQFYMKRRVRCPMCLKLVKQLDSLEQLPVNHTIFSKLLQKLNKQNKIDKNISVKSVLFGEFERAQKQALLLKNPPRIDPSSGLPLCPFHPDRVEHFFCETHRTNGCRICSELGHNDQQCQVIDLYTIDDQQIINELLSQLHSNRNQIIPPTVHHKHPQGIINDTLINNWVSGDLVDMDDDQPHHSV